MRRSFKTAFSSVKLLLLILLPDAIKMDDYCGPGDSTIMSIPFHALHKDICPLIKNVLSETTFGFPLECAMKCAQDPFCAGYNFKSKQRERNCQLTNTLRHNFDNCNADDKGWIFYHPVGSRKIPCHKMKNCKNGGKTIIDLKNGPGSDPYRCECADGYSGDLCEIVDGFDSQILSSELMALNFTKILRDWLPKTGTWTACWRATRDGWAASTFHSRCDGKVPTLTIVKVVKDSKNFIFGGYCNVTWAGNGYIGAPGSFIYSLRNNDGLSPFKSTLKNESDGLAIYRDTGYGSTFGPDSELFIPSDAGSNDNSKTNFGYSYNLPHGYTQRNQNTLPAWRELSLYPIRSGSTLLELTLRSHFFSRKLILTKTCTIP